VKRGELSIAHHTGASLATENSTNASPAKRWSQAVGFVSEDRKNEGLALSMSITDNMMLPGLTAFLNPSKLDQTADTWRSKLAIKCRSVRAALGELSGGNQQKVAIARLLEQDANILLLDEPTRGIDVGSKAQIYKLIDELARSGKAVLIVSSYLPELLAVCDRIAVMQRGVLCDAVPAAETDEHKIMQQAIGG
jgi:ribose transport system ATP-binding protein